MASDTTLILETLADMLEAIVALSYGDNRHRLVKICQDRQRLIDEALERPVRKERYAQAKKLPDATPDEAERMLNEARQRQQKLREQRTQHKPNGQPEF